MIDEAALAKCKKGVRLFNCARGGIIKESALVAALKCGPGRRRRPRRLRGRAARGLERAADAPERDPDPAPRAPRPPRPRTPSGVEVAEQIADVLNGGVIRNAVNMPTLDAATLARPPALPRPGREAGDPRPADLPGAGRLPQDHLLGQDRRPGRQRHHARDPARLAQAHQRRQRQLRERPVPPRAPRRALRGRQVDGRGGLHGADPGRGDRAPTASSAARPGTLIGKASSPRIVSINGRAVEVVATGKLLIIENSDEPGMIGYVGTLLGQRQGQHRQHVAQPPGARPDGAHGHQPGQRAERGRAARAQGPQGHQGWPSSCTSEGPHDRPRTW